MTSLKKAKNLTRELFFMNYEIVPYRTHSSRIASATVLLKLTTHFSFNRFSWAMMKKLSPTDCQLSSPEVRLTPSNEGVSSVHSSEVLSMTLHSTPKKTSLFRLRFPSSVLAVLPISLLATSLLSGCATSALDTAGTPLAALSGAVHGGQSPIQSATVTLYATTTIATGYGQAATVVGTAVSDAGGGFTILPSANATTCPAGQQAYIVAAGGYQSGQPTLVNNNSLMMAALGDCSTVNANTFIILNEVTTVAAAYALSGFTTITGTAPAYVVNISAPAANRASTGSSTAAAGLAHAFLNAAALASYSSGSANSTTSNISVAGTTVNGSVPAAEINTLGNILQSCIDGATGNASCTSLFSFTPSISGVAPTNTLQSVLNLARNPYPSAAAMTASSGLFSLSSANAAFSPSLSAQPPDWALAIVYTGAALSGPYDIALDANDTVYAGLAASSSVVGLSAYGAATPSFTAGSTGSATRQIAPDAVGNIWVTNYGSMLYKYSTASGGAPAAFAGYTQTFGVAVDKNNNVWVADAASTTPNISELASASSYATNYTATATGGFQPVELTVDANQNIWASAYYTNGNTAMVLPNLSAASASTPTYTTSGTIATPVSATFASSALKPLGVVIDASGNAWYGITGTNTTTSAGIEEVIPNLTSGVITSLTPQSLVTGATLGAKASQIPGIDGAGSIYLPDNQGTGTLGIHVYSTTSVSSSGTASQVLSPPSGYLACLPTAAPITCGTGKAAAVYNPRVIAIDSTGSVWAGITSGGFAQLIGLGAPSWPLLSAGKPGLAPGLTTVMPLP
jgi:hypothetical protein